MDTALHWLRWTIAIPLGVVFLLCAVGNWQILIGGLVQAFRTGKPRSSSLILPFIGPVIGIVFFLVVPVKALNAYFWVAPIIEPTWMMSVYCLVTGPIAKKMAADKNI